MTYFSIDVESTGLVPGVHGVTHVGVVECETEDHIEFTVTDAEHIYVWDPDTKKWADENLPKDELIHLPTRSAVEVCNYINAFLRNFDGPYTFVGWPASFDYPMLRHLFHVADVEWLFHYRTLDVKSYMAGMLGVSVDAKRDTLPEEFWIEPENAHNPYADALAQARSFMALRKHAEEKNA